MTGLNSIKTEPKIVYAFIMGTFIIASSILTFSIPVLVMQFFLAFITLPIILRKELNTVKIYLIIYIVSIIFVFLVYLANFTSYGSPYYIGGSDDSMFEQQGLQVYHANMYNPSEILESGMIGRWHNSPFFVVYISLLYRFGEFFGEYSTFLPLIINVYILIWVCLILEYLFKRYTNLNNTKINISLAVFALTPNIQYINSHVFRDTFNLLQILLIAFLFDRLLKLKHYTLKILLVLFLAFLIFITYYTRTNALLFAGVICLFILGEKLNLKRRYILIAIIPLLLMSDLFEALRFFRYIETYSNYILDLSGDGLSKYIFGQPLLPVGIFLRAFYAFITPFPNFLGLFKDPSRLLLDFTMLLVYIGVLAQILSIPFIIRRLIKFDWLILCFLTLFIGVIATTFTFRHILFYYPFMVAIAVDGFLMVNKIRRVQILLITGFIGFGLALIYLSLKLFG